MPVISLRRLPLALSCSRHAVYRCLFAVKGGSLAIENYCTFSAFFYYISPSGIDLVPMAIAFKLSPVLRLGYPIRKIHGKGRIAREYTLLCDNLACSKNRLTVQ